MIRKVFILHQPCILSGVQFVIKKNLGLCAIVLFISLADGFTLGETICTEITNIYYHLADEFPTAFMKGNTGIINLYVNKKVYVTSTN